MNVPRGHQNIEIGETITVHGIADGFRLCKGIYWVVKACKGARKNKVFTDRIEIRDGWVNGTNANRLHRFKLPFPERFKEGVYCVGYCILSKIRLVYEGTSRNYPDVSEAVKVHPDAIELTGINGTTHDISIVYTNLVRNMVDGALLNYDYVKDVLGKDEFWFIHLNYKAKRAPVVFASSCGRKVAVIQPINI